MIYGVRAFAAAPTYPQVLPGFEPGLADHLRHIGRIYPAQQYPEVVLLIDNAPWHAAKEKQSKKTGTNYYYPPKGMVQPYRNYYTNPPWTGLPYQRIGPDGPMPQQGQFPFNPESNGTNLPNNPSPKLPPANSNEPSPQGAPPNDDSNGGTR